MDTMMLWLTIAYRSHCVPGVTFLAWHVCTEYKHMPINVAALQSQQGGIFGLFGGASQSNTGHNIV